MAQEWSLLHLATDGSISPLLEAFFMIKPLHEVEHLVDECFAMWLVNVTSSNKSLAQFFKLTDWRQVESH
jgi:hypothetical protein